MVRRACHACNIIYTDVTRAQPLTLREPSTFRFYVLSSCCNLKSPLAQYESASRCPICGNCERLDDRLIPVRSEESVPFFSSLPERIRVNRFGSYLVAGCSCLLSLWVCTSTNALARTIVVTVTYKGPAQDEEFASTKSPDADYCSTMPTCGRGSLP